VNFDPPKTMIGKPEKLDTEQQNLSMTGGGGVGGLFMNSKFVENGELYTMDQTENSERIQSIERLRDRSPKLHLEVIRILKIRF
jgi:hypothetical protein